MNGTAAEVSALNSQAAGLSRELSQLGALKTDQQEKIERLQKALLKIGELEESSYAFTVTHGSPQPANGWVGNRRKDFDRTKANRLLPALHSYVDGITRLREDIAIALSKAQAGLDELSSQCSVLQVRLESTESQLQAK